VKTNVGYVVVAEFVVSSESAEEIGEAISILKKWNPDWNPAFFMSDFSEAEFLAIKKVFLYTFVTSTRNKRGKDGQRTINMVFPMKKEMLFLTCYVSVHMHQ